MRGEVEEGGFFSPVGQLDVGIPQLVEEGVCTRLQGGEARGGRVLQQPRTQGDGLRWRTGPEHLATNHTQGQESRSQSQRLESVNHSIER